MRSVALTCALLSALPELSLDLEAPAHLDGARAGGVAGGLSQPRHLGEQLALVLSTELIASRTLLRRVMSATYQA